MQENKMGTEKIGKLVWKMGLPMLLSMVLQALYNVVDTMFVINMGEDGTNGNLALSLAFPVQILMIAIGVGTGVGLNALLSKKLGEKDELAVNRTAGNGLFLAAVFYVLFLLFGAFGAKAYMRLTTDDVAVQAMGTDYLRICCCLSFGSIGFAIAERFLMATGKTTFSMLAQIAGALTNIILDYVFIYPLGWGIAGAAYATVIGQIVSFALAMTLHYATNKEINGHPRYIRPRKAIIGQIYKIGFPAFLMQGMLSLMMFGVLMLIGRIDDEYTRNLLSGSYGIYYKLMQTALFASFGLSNALITITSYNYALESEERVRQTVVHGILASVIATAALTVFFQCFATPVSKLFALTLDESSSVAKSDVLAVCKTALRVATLGYVFMGVTVAIQGVLQGFNEVYSPLILSALRLLVLVLPVAYLFTLTKNVCDIIWWTFPIAEVVTAVFAYIYLQRALKKRFPRKDG